MELTNEELIEKIYLGTMDSASRKEISEANKLFFEIKSKILSIREFLIPFINKSQLDESFHFESIALENEINSIEKLLNPLFIQKDKNETSAIEKRMTEVNQSFFSKIKIPTTKEKIEKILNHRNNLVEGLKIIEDATFSALYYPIYESKIPSVKNIPRGIMRIKDSSYNYSFDSEDYFPEGRYCGACMSSPCMCSDPEKTSTLY